MDENLSYLKINNHIFQIDGIGTVSFYRYPRPDGQYEIYVNYNGGHSMCLLLEKKEEAEEAFTKIGEALKAK